MNYEIYNNSYNVSYKVLKRISVNMYFIVNYRKVLSTTLALVMTTFSKLKVIQLSEGSFSFYKTIDILLKEQS